MYLWLTLGIIIGILFLALILTAGKTVWFMLTGKAQLIKWYWIFSIVFVVLATAPYILVLSYAHGHAQDIGISIANQATGLIFAIFIGYFAFSQVMESRKEKLDEKGLNALRAKDYDDAKKYYEQAHATSPKDYHSLSDLCEIYLITQDYGNLNRKMRLLDKVTNRTKRITYYYLSAGIQIMRGYINEANKSIELTVTYIEANSESFQIYRWNFQDIESSDAFQGLKGDQKKLFSNFIRYLSKQMSPEDKARYVLGDYLLNSTSSSVQSPGSVVV